MCHLGFSQDVEPVLPASKSDTTRLSLEEKPKVKKDYKPSNINIGIEGLGIARTFTSSGFSHLEFQGDIDFHRTHFVLDVGREENNLSNNEFDYSNSGIFYRTGIQINMMPYNVDRNFFFFGFRYARASFSDELNYKQTFDKWGEQNIDLKNSSLSARWFEVNMGMKVKVFKRIYFGYTLRFKLSKKLSGFDELTPRNIPGFGLADKGGNAGFNYYFLYNISLRDKPIPPRPKKIRRKSSNTSPVNNSFRPGQRPF